MWITAKMKKNGMALVIPADDVQTVTQEMGADVAVIIMRESSAVEHQAVTEMSVHHDLAGAVQAMIKITHPEKLAGAL